MRIVFKVEADPDTYLKYSELLLTDEDCSGEGVEFRYIPCDNHFEMVHDFVGKDAALGTATVLRKMATILDLKEVDIQHEKLVDKLDGDAIRALYDISENNRDTVVYLTEFLSDVLEDRMMHLRLLSHVAQELEISLEDEQDARPPSKMMN